MGVWTGRGVGGGVREFSVCGAWAVVWGYLGPLGAGTALLVLLTRFVKMHLDQWSKRGG